MIGHTNLPLPLLLLCETAAMALSITTKARRCPRQTGAAGSGEKRELTNNVENLENRYCDEARRIALIFSSFFECGSIYRLWVGLW
jgi:hypothetical protein